MLEYTITHCDEADHLNSLLKVDFVNKKVILGCNEYNFTKKPIVNFITFDSVAMLSIFIKLASNVEFILIQTGNGFFFELDNKEPPVSGRKVGGGGENVHLIDTWFSEITNWTNN